MVRSVPTRAAMVALLAVAAPGMVDAQGGDGFLFREPRVTLKFETGYGFQRAQGALFDDLLARQTLDRRSFDSPYLGGELAVRVDERVDVAIGVGYQGSSTVSELWEWEGTDGLPIEQVNELTLVPVTVAGRYFLKPRGRSIGRFAWVPEKVVPYVGAGIGLMSYSLEISGEFVDESDPGFPIYTDRLTSSRTTFMARGLAGVDLALGSQFVLNGEARYNYARGTLDPDFSGFGDIDLDGFQLVAGVAVRF